VCFKCVSSCVCPDVRVRVSQGTFAVGVLPTPCPPLFQSTDMYHRELKSICLVFEVLHKLTSQIYPLFPPKQVDRAFAARNLLGQGFEGPVQGYLFGRRFRSVSFWLLCCSVLQCVVSGQERPRVQKRPRVQTTNRTEIFFLFLQKFPQQFLYSFSIRKFLYSRKSLSLQKFLHAF